MVFNGIKLNYLGLVFGEISYIEILFEIDIN